MTAPDSSSSVKTLYNLGFPINLTIELLVQFLALLLPVYLIFKAFLGGNLLNIALVALLCLYLYPLGILLLGGLLTRYLPKPSLGYLRTPADHFKYQTLSALSFLIRRTPARWFLSIPATGTLFYNLCGAKLKEGAWATFPDTLPDPYFISMGKNSVAGWDSLILGHCAPAPNTLYVGRVEIGDNVLIGAKAIVWPNVQIGDNAIIQNCAVVIPGTIIPPNEIWGGIPAQKVGMVKSKKAELSSPKPLESHLFNLFGQREWHETTPLLQQSCSVAEFNRLLRNLEKDYDQFIDRTTLDISTLTLQDIRSLIQPKELQES